jgi:Mor family transcriptional regulator
MTGIIQEMHRVVTNIVGDENQASAVVYALISNFGGERLYIPPNDYQKRNREMIELHKAGAKTCHLASRYRLSIRTVYRILGESENR